MSIKDIKPAKFEEEANIVLEPEERLRELAAEILIECQDRWRTEIFDHLSDEEIKEYIATYGQPNISDYSTSFLQYIQYELNIRKSLARAQEVGLPYCIYHDCKLGNCPKDSHL